MGGSQIVGNVKLFKTEDMVPTLGQLPSCSAAHATDTDYDNVIGRIILVQVLIAPQKVVRLVCQTITAWKIENRYLVFKT